jgi:site-specific recombinase XerD
MALDDLQQPGPNPPGLLTEVVPLHPTATVAGALELLPRPDLDPVERLALAFLAEYPPNSARAYRSDLHAWAAWTLTVAGVHPLQARRHHAAAWVRQLTREPSARTGKPLAAASVARRLAYLSKFYGYGLEVGVLIHSPVPHVRRPKVSEESASVGLTRDALGRVLDTGAAHSPRASALVHLLAFNGLGITEALNADVNDVIHDRGHRALRITRKGGKTGRVAIPPVTSRRAAARTAEQGDLCWHQARR